MFDKNDFSILISVCALLISVVAGTIAPIIDGINRRKSERRKQIAIHSEKFWQLANQIVNGTMKDSRTFTATAWTLESHLSHKKNRSLLENFKRRLRSFSVLPENEKNLLRDNLREELDCIIEILHKEMY